MTDKKKTSAQIRAQIARWETSLKRDQDLLKAAQLREAQEAERDVARARTVESIYAALGIVEVADDPTETKRLQMLVDRLNAVIRRSQNDGSGQ